MPKRLSYQLQWSSQTHRYDLLHDGKPVVPRIEPDSQGWFAWLETLPAFSFHSRSGACWTIRKETVQRGGTYWYAYRRIRRRMVKRYLARSADLTLARLEAVIAALDDAQSLRWLPLPANAEASANPSSASVPGEPCYVAPGTQTMSMTPAADRPAVAGTPPHLLLATKFDVPRAARLIRRPHVEQGLQHGLERPLTLVVAPAGFGKTSSISSWVQHRGRSVAWVSLDENENDPVQFWTYALTALNRAYRGIAEAALAQLQAPHPPPLKGVVDTLLNAVATCPHEVILILDQYHLITVPAIHESLALLFAHPPTPLHLYLATRISPPLPLARMIAYDQVSEIRADALRFRADEAAPFLREIMGVPLSEEEVRQLTVRTDGWITGLQLAALSLKTHPEPSRFIDTFGGKHVHLLTYLSEEVLAAQPDRLQSFLLQTSILDRLCSALCDAVTGRDDSQAILESLAQANLFLVPLDEKGCWYRYAPLFADFLRHRLHQQSVASLPTLHRRAARWLEERGWVMEALEHLFAVPEVNEAARVIEQAALPLFMRGEILSLQHWMDRLPEEVITARPALCLGQASLFFLLGQLEAAEQRIEVASAWLLTHPASKEQERDGHPQHYLLQGVVATTRAVAAVQRGKSKDAIRYATSALEVLPEDEVAPRASVAVPLGIAYALQGEMQAANTTFAEAARLNLAAKNLPMTTIALNLRAQVCVQQGQVRRAAELYRETIRLTEQEDGTARPIASGAYAGLGGVLYEWNDLVAAKLALEKAVELGKLRAYGEDQVNGYAQLAFVYQAQGQAKAALEAFQTAEHLLEYLVQTHAAPPWLVSHLASWRLRLALRQHRLRDIQPWIQELGLADDRAIVAEGEQFQEFEWLTFARVFLAHNRLKSAASVLSHLLHGAEREGRGGSLVEILLLQARVAQAQGRLTAALSTLQEALSLAEPEGYVRIFVDEGLPLRSLLVRLREAHPRHTVLRCYLDTLVAAYTQSEIQWRQADRLLIEPLSEREREVLHLIAQGCSTQEMARMLVVAPSTVKTHLHHLFAKLQAADRLQAVTRARALGLLEQ